MLLKNVSIGLFEGPSGGREGGEREREREIEERKKKYMNK